MENTIDITDVISCDSVNIFTNTGDTFKKSAGAVAQKSGKEFENFVRNKLQNILNDIKADRKIIEGVKKYRFCGVIDEQPKYTDHYGRANKRKDFAIQKFNSPSFLEQNKWEPLQIDPKIIIEAKWLGDCGSHVQKLDYEWANLRENCYGENFWIIYDYDRTVKCAIETVDMLSKYCKKLKEEVKLKNINFEWIDVKDLEIYVNNAFKEYY
tara:strand:- start:102 stop:734 length:633 start_codon:yes stop_codon:yes gene_type:complete